MTRKERRSGRYEVQAVWQRSWHMGTAAEYAGVSRPTLYNLLKRPTAYFPQTLRLMRALSIPVEEMRAAISYPW